ncbi:MAG TPA: exonuclease SbcCD subunit D [Blastocatellia bacterium]|nr:exonuclease SbcCD subunit D [Blastocatellia bacterium]
MTRFLHIADIHLGIRRYRMEERTTDFFHAWRDCIERYALKEKVSFVLIAGDFFDTRRVEPVAMNHAMFCLVKLREAGIPVVVIEGNHDQREALQKASWLQSLSQWGFIRLLEPEYDEGGVVFTPWNEKTRRGSFTDIDGVRIFGSTWYGTTVGRMLPALIDEMRQHRSEQHYNVMMLHTDIEGQQNRPIPALPVAKLTELRSVVDYLALGHTHKNFEIEGWACNPGSLEACNVDEYANVRGAYLVEIAGGSHRAQLMRDYHQRPFIRLDFDVSGRGEPEELREALFAKLRVELPAHSQDETDDLAPVVDLSLRGHLGFKTALLELSRIRDEIRNEFHPFAVQVRDQTVPVEYAVATGAGEHVSRAERERLVIQDLITRDARFRDQAVEMAGLVLEARRLALAGEAPAKIADLIEQRLAEVDAAGSLEQAAGTVA